MGRQQNEVTLAKKELIRSMLKEPIWASKLAERCDMSPQLLNYYLKKYFSDEVVVILKEGNNKKLALKQVDIYENK